jgi:hypothetical protein
LPGGSIAASYHQPAKNLAWCVIAADACNVQRMCSTAPLPFNAPQCNDSGIVFYFNGLGGFSKPYPQACTQNL